MNGQTQLWKLVNEYSSTVPIMNQFEGLDEEGIRYDQLIIWEAKTSVFDEWKNYYVIERHYGKCIGSISLTEFKKQTYPAYSAFKRFINEQISKSVVKNYISSDQMFLFSKPYQLRAQNKNNRIGYGDVWRNGIQVYEGTKYGECSSYAFIGAYIKPRSWSPYMD